LEAVTEDMEEIISGQLVIRNSTLKML